MGKVPPLAESFAVINSSKSTTASLNTTFKLDSIRNTVPVVLATIVDSDWLRDSQGMAFNGKGIRVFQLVNCAIRVFVFHPVEILRVRVSMGNEESETTVNKFLLKLDRNQATDNVPSYT